MPGDHQAVAALAGVTNCDLAGPQTIVTLTEANGRLDYHSAASRQPYWPASGTGRSSGRRP